ncbi:lysylphosphatidylglycerol synthase transmembrane domain-containing protein [Streptomyces sp. TS71-3]|uniref:lysylphosphatidylglycerol synthase transmembrane domain-containing protein n=1 Tax=Streptomyces sp. TS71-3 TaxID=2733862 RepID=UPI0020177CEC|nr:lysylphosphatidylglycerol synthase transmembrane domain-containing protein [Streptomyces sp. TS71-3]
MKRFPVRTVVCVIVLVAFALWVVQNHHTVQQGFERVLGAEPSWLAVACATTVLTWVAAACARQGSVVEQLPPVRLLATQFAAGSANHILPSGFGAGAVNLRFMTVCGIPLARSSAALALYLLAESVGRVTLLVVLFAVFPHALPLAQLLPDGVGLPLSVGAGVLALAVVLALVCVRRLREIMAKFLRTALSEARSLHARPSRVLALWGGSLAFPALQAAGLVAVGMSLHVPVEPMYLVVGYLAATVAVALVPTPGGVGSVDAALVVVLITAGAPPATATAVVLAFRLISAWLPLLPGVVTLGMLVRYKVL